MSECLTLRPATKDDEALLLHWRNLPWVVALGASRRAVSATEHRRWFRETLRHERRCLFLVSVDQVRVGMLRYDRHGDASAEFSLYLMQEHCGRGLGRQAFMKSLPLLLDWCPVTCLTVRVQETNARSIRFFESLGFQRDIQTTEPGVIFLGKNLAPIPHSRPFLGEPEAAVVAEVIRSRHVATGIWNDRLEQLWCELTGMPGAVCVGSGLAALRLALLALGIGRGDEVIIPAYSCVALANAVLALDATPVPADIDPGVLTLSVSDVQRRLTNRTRAIIAVDLFGMPAPVEGLQQLRLPVIEDCAHGIGGRHAHSPFGGGTELAISSFYATKMVCGGSGGIVAGQRPQYLERVRRAREYGDQPPDGQHLNDQMTEMAAAMVCTQLDNLSEILARRAELASAYEERLQPLAEKGMVQLAPKHPGRIWYRYTVGVQKAYAADVCRWMARHGVRAEQPVWDLRGTNLWTEDLPNSDVAFDRTVSLPLYPDLSNLEQEVVCECFIAFLERL